MKQKIQKNLCKTKNVFTEERAQVSFEYLLTAVFAMLMAIGAAIVVDALRQTAVDAQADLLNTRSSVIEKIMQ